MVILDVIAGIYLPNFWAWMFLLFVLIAEGLLLSLYLRKVQFDRKIYLCVIFSNSITTLIGFLLFDEKNYGGHLLNWIPLYVHGWALETGESHEVLLWSQTILFLFVSFIASTIFEAILNFIILRRTYKTKAIFKGTLIVNLVTYLVGALIIFSYGFTITY